jgi:hypothetical protein
MNGFALIVFGKQVIVVAGNVVNDNMSRYDLKVLAGWWCVVFVLLFLLLLQMSPTVSSLGKFVELEMNVITDGMVE